jgi:NADH:ubiquinone oxidoreductase subunit H
MLYQIILYIKPLILFLIIVVFLLVAVAFFTILERHIMGYIHKRTGPNNVGFFGLFQAFADGLKLLVKESIFPRSSNFLIFLIAPVLTFTLTISN